MSFDNEEFYRVVARVRVLGNESTEPRHQGRNCLRAIVKLESYNTSIVLRPIRHDIGESPFSDTKTLSSSCAFAMTSVSRAWVGR
jgi:hypothetical protein